MSPENKATVLSSPMLIMELRDVGAFLALEGRMAFSENKADCETSTVQTVLSMKKRNTQDANMTGQSAHSRHVIAAFYGFSKVVKYSRFVRRN